MVAGESREDERTDKTKAEGRKMRGGERVRPRGGYSADVGTRKPVRGWEKAKEG